MSRRAPDPEEVHEPRKAAASDPEQPPPSSAAAGAEDFADLIAQAEQAAATLGVRAPTWRGRREGGAPSASTIRKMKELVAKAEGAGEQDESMMQLCRDALGATFEGVGVATGEPKWPMYLDRRVHAGSPLTRLDYLAESYARCLRAWGADFSGPWAATIAVVLATGRVTGAIAAEIAAEKPPELKQEKAN